VDGAGRSRCLAIALKIHAKPPIELTTIICCYFSDVGGKYGIGGGRMHVAEPTKVTTMS
jgi:hypothetical protein